MLLEWREFKTAADLGHINGAEEYAKVCSLQSNEEEATKYFLIAAIRNHAKVKLQTALYLEKKVGDQNNLLSAALFFRELSVIGYAEEMYHCGFLLIFHVLHTTSFVLHNLLS